MLEEHVVDAKLPFLWFTNHASFKEKSFPGKRRGTKALGTDDSSFTREIKSVF